MIDSNSLSYIFIHSLNIGNILYVITHTQLRQVHSLAKKRASCSLIMILSSSNNSKLEYIRIWLMNTYFICTIPSLLISCIHLSCHSSRFHELDQLVGNNIRTDPGDYIPPMGVMDSTLNFCVSKGFHSPLIKQYTIIGT